MRRIIILVLATMVPAGAARAQAIDGFRVGDSFGPALHAHPPPSDRETIGGYVAAKWEMPDGTSVSVTASPRTGRIVFVEQDAGEASGPSALPGLVFTTTSLADIRQRFGSKAMLRNK